MASRIADLVNQTLAEEKQDAKLESSDILNLIDSGRSVGGSQAPPPPVSSKETFCPIHNLISRQFEHDGQSISLQYDCGWWGGGGATPATAA